MAKASTVRTRLLGHTVISSGKKGREVTKLIHDIFTRINCKTVCPKSLVHF